MLITAFVMSSCKMMPFSQQFVGQASYAMHTLMCLNATSNPFVVLQADYCIKLDRKWSIDGRDRAADTSVFSPCHMNHSGSRQNVVRSTKRRQRKISFFTQRDIQVSTCKWNTEVGSAGCITAKPACVALSGFAGNSLYLMMHAAPDQAGGLQVCLTHLQGCFVFQQVGEELLLDYGSTYWKTREDQMLE